MSKLGSISFAIHYEKRSYALLWERQLLTMTTKTQCLSDADSVELQVVDEFLCVVSVRPLVVARALKRPCVRSECADVPRPCPFVGCFWNTYLDLQEDGSLVINWAQREPDEMEAWGSCVLDIADGGGIPDENLMLVLGLTAKEVSSICEGALRKLRHYGVADRLGVFKSTT